MSGEAQLAAVKEYIAKYNLEDELSNGVNLAIKQNSDDPFRVISDYLRTLAKVPCLELANLNDVHTRARRCGRVLVWAGQSCSAASACVPHACWRPHAPCGAQDADEEDEDEDDIIQEGDEMPMPVNRGRRQQVCIELWCRLMIQPEGALAVAGPLTEGMLCRPRCWYEADGLAARV